jgi:hypothetical protein
MQLVELAYSWRSVMPLRLTAHTVVTLDVDLDGERACGAYRQHL